MPKHRLALIGLQGREIPESEDVAPRNLVFLHRCVRLDEPPDKLPLVRSAMRMLADVLTARDRVAIVVYAGASGLVLPSTPGDQKATIHRRHRRARSRRLDQRRARASAGLSGRARALHQGRRQPRHPRTDGDFNVGVTSQDELVRLIEEKRAERRVPHRCSASAPAT